MEKDATEAQRAQRMKNLRGVLREENKTFKVICFSSLQRLVFDVQNTCKNVGKGEERSNEGGTKWGGRATFFGRGIGKERRRRW